MWFRRDLRLEDNTALSAAFTNALPILPLFIFDTNILNELPKNDARVSFIHRSLLSIDQQLKKLKSGLHIEKGDPLKVWEKLIDTHDIDTVFVNRDYEPYALKRDDSIKQLLLSRGVKLATYQDQVIFEPHHILKPDGKPYSIYTPYKNKWLEAFSKLDKSTWSVDDKANNDLFLKPNKHSFPTITDLGFTTNKLQPAEINLAIIPSYDQYRDYPEETTTFAGTYLRFGLISIRKLVLQAQSENQVYLSELIWREFFTQIMFHYPHVINHNFKKAYDHIIWRNNPEDFQRWCTGTTGFPLVDAGMRELNNTGFMHNRVRMVTAGFLCKHLLIDWRWGEAYFASKLFDYELASNNGNWQWASGTGCDAAPYFRVFNPERQANQFDPYNNYIKKWIPEFGTSQYAKPMIDHVFARQRAIETYKNGLKN